MVVPAARLSALLSLVSVVVFAIGVQTLWAQSPAWQNSGGQAMPLKALVVYVLTTFVLGSIMGLLIGFALQGICRLAGRPDLRPIRVTYFITLNAVAIILLWMAPKLA
jgi:hypothetical protein